MLLNVARLPREALYGPERNQIDLASIVLDLRDVIGELSKIKSVGGQPLVKPNDSFGFAVAKPDPKLDWENSWDDPYEFIWFVAGWGPDQERYIANAMRKLRAALREVDDSLALRIENPEAFRDKVSNKPGDTEFEWGDFPWGGAALVQVGDLILPISCSGYKEVEDHAVSCFGGGLIGATMLKLGNPAEFLD